jgi:hypothetical protein
VDRDVQENKDEVPQKTIKERKAKAKTKTGEENKTKTVSPEDSHLPESPP